MILTHIRDPNDFDKSYKYRSQCIVIDKNYRSECYRQQLQITILLTKITYHNVIDKNYRLEVRGEV